MAKTKIAKGVGLTSLTVSDIKKAKHLLVDCLGLELKEYAEEYKWMEIEGEEGGRIGIGQAPAGSPEVGTNGVLSIGVDHIESAKEELEAKGVKFTGDIMEIPGHVKLAPFVDEDGNAFFLAQKLD